MTVLIPLRVTRLFVPTTGAHGRDSRQVLIPLRVTRLFVRPDGITPNKDTKVLIPLRVTRLFVLEKFLKAALERKCLNPSQGHPPLRTQVNKFEGMDGYVS